MRKYYPCNCGFPFHVLVVSDLRDLTDDDEITDEQNDLLLALITEVAPFWTRLRWAWRYLRGKEDFYWHEIVLNRDVAFLLGIDLQDVTYPDDATITTGANAVMVELKSDEANPT